MNADAAAGAFRQCLASNGHLVEGLMVPEGLTAVLNFYRQVRFDDAPLDSDGDMLLVQWGLRSCPRERTFDFDLTRQFILNGVAEDENIWQLSLRFRFKPLEDLEAIDAGSKWCEKPRPRAVDAFESFIRASPAYRAVFALTPENVDLDYFNAG